MKKIILILAAALATMGCGSKSTPTPTNLPPVNNKPGKATLIAPSQNGVCVTGVVESDTTSTVTFTWNSSAKTAGYKLVLTNLLTKDSVTKTVSDTTIALSILRNTPYSWHVVSKSSVNTGTAQSTTWKFYNAGPAVVTYAPFPAELISPSSGASVPAGTVKLTWSGSSVNPGTIINYDVYLGTGSTPALLKGMVTDTTYSATGLTAATTYYWKVITRDSAGNTSDSGTYQFSTN